MWLFCNWCTATVFFVANAFSALLPGRVWLCPRRTALSEVACYLLSTKPPAKQTWKDCSCDWKPAESRNVWRKWSHAGRCLGVKQVKHADLGKREHCRRPGSGAASLKGVGRGLGRGLSMKTWMRVPHLAPLKWLGRNCLSWWNRLL